MKPIIRVRTAMSLATLVGAMLAGAPHAAPASSPIQPGAFMGSAGRGCTMNFIFDGLGGQAGTKVYVGTAEHCVAAVGDPVVDGDGVTWGRVAFMAGREFYSDKDFAFVEVLPEHLFRVEASVKGHPGYPTGFTTTEQTRAGDLLQLSGYGGLFSSNQIAREQRIGILVDDHPSVYGALDPAVPGDSGGPVVHIPTGKALGIVSAFCIPDCQAWGPNVGPRVESMLEMAAAAGFPLVLRVV